MAKKAACRLHLRETDIFDRFMMAGGQGKRRCPVPARGTGSIMKLPGLAGGLSPGKIPVGVPSDPLSFLPAAFCERHYTGRREGIMRTLPVQDDRT